MNFMSEEAEAPKSYIKTQDSATSHESVAKVRFIELGSALASNQDKMNDPGEKMPYAFLSALVS